MTTSSDYRHVSRCWYDVAVARDAVANSNQKRKRVRFSNIQSTDSDRDSHQLRSAQVAQRSRPGMPNAADDVTCHNTGSTMTSSALRLRRDDVVYVAAHNVDVDTDRTRRINVDTSSDQWPSRDIARRNDGQDLTCVPHRKTKGVEEQVHRGCSVSTTRPRTLSRAIKLTTTTTTTETTITTPQRRRSHQKPQQYDEIRSRTQRCLATVETTNTSQVISHDSSAVAIDNDAAIVAELVGEVTDVTDGVNQRDHVTEALESCCDVTLTSETHDDVTHLLKESANDDVTTHIAADDDGTHARDLKLTLEATEPSRVTIDRREDTRLDVASTVIFDDNSLSAKYAEEGKELRQVVGQHDEHDGENTSERRTPDDSSCLLVSDSVDEHDQLTVFYEIEEDSEVTVDDVEWTPESTEPPYVTVDRHEDTRFYVASSVIFDDNSLSTTCSEEGKELLQVVHNERDGENRSERETRDDRLHKYDQMSVVHETEDSEVTVDDVESAADYVDGEKRVEPLVKADDDIVCDVDRLPYDDDDDISTGDGQTTSAQQLQELAFPPKTIDIACSVDSAVERIDWNADEESDVVITETGGCGSSSHALYTSDNAAVTHTVLTAVDDVSNMDHIDSEHTQDTDQSDVTERAQIHHHEPHVDDTQPLVAKGDQLQQFLGENNDAIAVELDDVKNDVAFQRCLTTAVTTSEVVSYDSNVVVIDNDDSAELVDLSVMSSGEVTDVTDSVDERDDVIDTSKSRCDVTSCEDRTHLSIQSPNHDVTTNFAIDDDGTYDRDVRSMVEVAGPSRVTVDRREDTTRLNVSSSVMFDEVPNAYFDAMFVRDACMSSQSEEVQFNVHSGSEISGQCLTVSTMSLASDDSVAIVKSSASDVTRQSDVEVKSLTEESCVPSVSVMCCDSERDEVEVDGGRLVVYDYGETWSVFREMALLTEVLRAEVIERHNNDPRISRLLTRYPRLRPSTWMWTTPPLVGYLQQRRGLDSELESRPAVSVQRGVSQCSSYPIQPVIERWTLVID